MTATKTETPSTNPTCRDIVTTAEPVDVRAGGRSAVAADTIVGNANPTPIPPISQPGSMSVTYDGCAPTDTATSDVPTPKSRQPTAVNTPTATRPASRWATAANT